MEPPSKQENRLSLLLLLHLSGNVSEDKANFLPGKSDTLQLACGHLSLSNHLIGASKAFFPSTNDMLAFFSGLTDLLPAALQFHFKEKKSSLYNKGFMTGKANCQDGNFKDFPEVAWGVY